MCFEEHGAIFSRIRDLFRVFRTRIFTKSESAGKKPATLRSFSVRFGAVPKVEPFMKLMGRFQDSLGKTNDAIVARHILAAIKPGRLDPSVIGLAQEWSQSRVAKCLRTAQPQWRRLRKLEPFWEE